MRYIYQPHEQGISLGAIVPTLSSRYIHADIHVKGTATTPIQHVVVIMLENHSFDTMFGRFPGVNGITLPRASNPFTSDIDHSGPAEVAAVDGGKMDGFAKQGQVQYRFAHRGRYSIGRVFYETSTYIGILQ